MGSSGSRQARSVLLGRLDIRSLNRGCSASANLKFQYPEFQPVCDLRFGVWNLLRW